ncbi:hypothetical protein, partial [Aeromonas taiwanensis]|uniref:hypothetical protein n=1 Tax=Aeromonas taiwanensis TaxID=633417 RepID=UPI00207CAA03
MHYRIREHPIAPPWGESNLRIFTTAWRIAAPVNGCVSILHHSIRANGRIAAPANGCASVLHHTIRAN